MKRHIPFYLLIMIALSLLAGGCAISENTAKDSSKLTVAVSIVPQQTYVKEIAGDLIEVVTAIPPGKSPANYAPIPQELEKISRSAVYFAIGVPAEESAILPKLKNNNEKMKIINLHAKVSDVYPDREFSPEHRDPHIWLSPKRTALLVEEIAAELAAIDPENSSIYEQNAQDYIARLHELDREIANTFSSLTNRTFIIYHPALGYFADDYDLEMIAIEAEGKDAAPTDLQKVIDIAREKKVNTVFYQAEVD